MLKGNLDFLMKMTKVTKGLIIPLKESKDEKTCQVIVKGLNQKNFPEIHVTVANVTLLINYRQNNYFLVLAICHYACSRFYASEYCQILSLKWFDLILNCYNFISQHISPTYFIKEV